MAFSPRCSQSERIIIHSDFICVAKFTLLHTRHAETPAYSQLAAGLRRWPRSVPPSWCEIPMKIQHTQSPHTPIFVFVGLREGEGAAQHHFLFLFLTRNNPLQPMSSRLTHSNDTGTAGSIVRYDPKQTVAHTHMHLLHDSRELVVVFLGLRVN